MDVEAEPVRDDIGGAPFLVDVDACRRGFCSLREVVVFTEGVFMNGRVQGGDARPACVVIDMGCAQCVVDVREVGVMIKG